jgi:hypothetical protein
MDVLIALLLSVQSIYGTAESLSTLPSAGIWWRRVSLLALDGLPVASHWWALESILLLKVFPAPCFSGDCLLPLMTKAARRLPLSLWALAFLSSQHSWPSEAIESLLAHEPPQTSFIGIGLSIVSLIIMPLLVRAKRRSASNLESRAMKADSRQTDLCAYLSAILLGGLALNALLGWWWADPVAALIMVPIIAREGFEGLRGEVCEDCH